MKKLIVFFALAFAISGCGTWNGANHQGGVRYVDEFDLSYSSCGMGKTVQKNKSVLGSKMSIAGVKYDRGFGTHAESAVVFKANGKVESFEATVGLDDDGQEENKKTGWGNASAQFIVWADGRIAWSSGEIKIGSKAIDVVVPLDGVREIILETRGGGEWTAWNAANADWANARFNLKSGGKINIVKDRSLFAQLGILTPPESPLPQFNGADIWGVRPGREVIFRVPVSGSRPMSFSAKNLPAGVTFDEETGVLGGKAPEKKGNYDIIVRAKNEFGSAEKTIRLAVGDTIALTPPMGWNSWNTKNFRVTADCVKAAALALENSGLANYGWAYINIDDWWQMNNNITNRRQTIQRRQKHFNGREDVMGPARDKNGKIIPNRSFPDMKALADYIHSFGFKAGLYSSPGAYTCGSCEGSLGHELQDAESWAEWGYDYVKYDWCSYGNIFLKETAGREITQEDFSKPYQKMNECLKKQSRDILYSFCQYGMGNVERWARATGANCWRSWGDLKDGWHWMEKAIEGNIMAEYWKYSGPGCWADPDMMIVGQQFSFGSDHPTYLTPNEQYTHVSLWCMIGSPLLIGCDLTTMDEFTKKLLSNDAVLAVSQDRLGKVARRIRHVDGESVWVRDLHDGAKAVAIVNRSPIEREIGFSFVEAGFGNGMYWVKDLWRKKCEGRHSGTYSARVQAHATKLIYIRPDTCVKCD
jgi:alpha-galactosidase